MAKAPNGSAIPGFPGEKPQEWWRVELKRLQRKVARLGNQASRLEALAQQRYQQMTYLYKEIYKLERAIQEAEEQGL